MTLKEHLEKTLETELTNEDVIDTLVELRRCIKRGQQLWLVAAVREWEKAEGKKVL